MHQKEPPKTKKPGNLEPPPPAAVPPGNLEPPPPQQDGNIAPPPRVIKPVEG